MAKKKFVVSDFGPITKVKETSKKKQIDEQALRQADKQAQLTKSVDIKDYKTQALRQALRQAEFKKLIDNKSKKVKQTIRIDRQKYIQIKTYCNEKNISFQSVMDDLIDVFYNEL